MIAKDQPMPPLWNYRHSQYEKTDKTKLCDEIGKVFGFPDNLLLLKYIQRCTSNFRAQCHIMMWTADDY